MPARRPSSPRPRSTPRQQRAVEMRARLLTGTIELLQKKPGYLPTTYQLARHVHVSIGTVYRYFTDIESVMDELRTATIHDITTRLATGIGRAMDQAPADAIVTIVETLTSAFEEHEAVVRTAFAAGGSELGGQWKDIERPLLPLARIMPTRIRPDLDDDVLDDLVFLTMGATASLCMRVALFRPAGSDRTKLVATTARMLLAAFEGADAG
ncbi:MULTISPECIES: TetR/AcrR family transcriptional regulator [unclassified Rhodococcus (in: high G+C Gram-positive bacteria)]|uniref:TetR/AcrR family transcriptional regulator n=1 Tax=unclassified Rhodococcus (in: high G+C Gram-positive bacteria) TaxID=192944 RepID=UPI00279549CC|nr:MULTISPECIES: TetR/AcrR family transcriptional regulator [unclassified Rhodococcus (in: high G+C Gram-positive bacteria)]